MTNNNESDPKIERVDDIPVVYGLLDRMGIQSILDDVLEAHGNWSGLSLGWVITIWLIHIVSQKNHLMEPVQQWVRQHQIVLGRLSGQAVQELDFTDDRLAICLRKLSDLANWATIEERLGHHLIRIYDLCTDLLRLDATVGEVYQTPESGSLFQVGKAKNGLYKTLFKLMLASLDPLGLPLVVDVKPGNTADDPLYLPSYQRAKAILQRTGLLVVGDSKMSALGTRATMVAGQDSYLVPLADKKDEPELLSQLLEEWWEQGAKSVSVFLSGDLPGNLPGNLPDDLATDSSELDLTLAIAHGFEVTRPRTGLVNGVEITWEERLLVVQSYSYQRSTLAGLHQRLDKAEAALIALTPPRQRGKKQIQSEAQLLLAIDQMEKKYRVQGSFTYDYAKEETERQVRPYKGNPARTESQVRYQLTVTRNQTAIEAAEFAAGWRIYATNEAPEKLSLSQAVMAYRDQIIEENIFRRLHGKMLSITPLYLQREDHARGLIHLLSIGARLLALGDYLAREALAESGEALAEVYAGNAKRSTTRPTTERMLKAFEGINLLILPPELGGTAMLTDMKPVHQRILDLLGLPSSLFACLRAA